MNEDYHYSENRDVKLNMIAKVLELFVNQIIVVQTVSFVKIFKCVKCSENSNELFLVHSAPNKPLRPPSHFYASNFSCVPGKPIPAGFQFAYCSNISRTISYVGVVNKCGNIQHITKHSKCKTDSDCFPGNICVWIVDEGTCFRNPEDCYKSTWYYVAIVSCFMSFVTMLLYFLTRTFYEHPEKVNEYLPHMSLFTYDITEKAKYEAFNIYGTEGMDIHQINAIVRNGTEKAWEEDEKSMDKPAFEHILVKLFRVSYSTIIF
uniref:DX domain-containing protein n=1 Tax=Caenorhabditis tropicalis TaxID=1561998 RepID=A0A1I7UMX6_9PELO